VRSQNNCIGARDEFERKIIACKHPLSAEYEDVQSALDLPMNDAASPSHPSDNDAAALLLRIATVVRITGLGRSTIYRLMADDRFPAPVRVTSRLVAWRRADLQYWTDSKSPVTYATREVVVRGEQGCVPMPGVNPSERGARAGRV
jgi:prophage regulatory protein